MEINGLMEQLDLLKVSLVEENGKLVLKSHSAGMSPDQMTAIRENHAIVDFIKKNKLELLDFISKRDKLRTRGRSSGIISIYRLSGLQHGVLFHGLYDRTGAYIIQFRSDLTNVDLDIFERTWNFLVASHSVFRTGFNHTDFNIPVQYVCRDVHMPMTVIDLRHLGGTERSRRIEEYETADKETGFDFGEIPLMRITMIRTTDMTYRMLWTSHHLLTDGWSMPVLVEEFLQTYERLLSGQELVVSEDRYEDYIRYLDGRDKEAEELFWRDYLKDLGENSLLPFIPAGARRIRGAGNFNEANVLIDEQLTLQIQSFSRQHHITVNTIMQGVWALLLHRYTSKRNIGYGVTVSGRPGDLPGVERKVGIFINTLPLHSVMNGDENVVDWLSGIQESQSRCREYQYSVLPDIQKLTGIQGDMFDTILSFMNFPVNNVISRKEWDLKVENVRLYQQTNYPLSITIGVSTEINVLLLYNTDQISGSFVRQIGDQFGKVCAEITSHGGRRTGDIDILTVEQRHRLTNGFNQETSPFPAGMTIPEIFTEQALRVKHRFALAAGDESLTYADLDERSNKLAHFLRKKGVRPQQLVPVCMKRGVDLIVTILGILKSGAAYVPIDPEYPDERVNFMIRDVQCELVLTDVVSFEKRTLPEGVEIVRIDREWEYVCKESGLHLSIPGTPESPAYVMYTSGTTGKPKGVMVSHRNVVSLVKGVSYISFGSNDIVLSTGSPSFDASTLEYWGVLLNGGKLVVPVAKHLLDTELLKGLIRRHSVNKMWFTASWFNQLVDLDTAIFEGLDTVVVGGEKLSEEHINAFFKAHRDTKVINGYGPTENTTFSLTFTMQAANSFENIPIGRPLTNRRAYILDGQQRPVPVGVTGEIYVAGAGVASGYLNNPELTAERFLADPFAGETGARMYWTGDLGRWLPDGNIEYHGRADRQIKIRGNRVEPAEIESLLQQSGKVRQAVVLARKDQSGALMLVGYVVAEHFGQEEMVGYLQERLPEYMIPRIWVRMESLPLTINGKIDKDALPSPDVQNTVPDDHPAPQNQTEQMLKEIWEELLQLERVGTRDDFFDLGGHSLLAIRVISLIRKKLKTELSITDLFDHPTIEGLAEVLEMRKEKELLPPVIAEQRPERIPLSFSQERLWFIDQLDGSLQYHVPAVLRLRGRIDDAALEYALRAIVDRHEVLRTVIREEDGQPYQEIQPGGCWQLQRLETTEDRLSGLVSSLIRAPFDLSKDMMLRATLIRIGEDEQTLALTVHHIASDGWSIPILVGELVELYHAYAEARPVNLPSLPVQYADYALWQRRCISGELLAGKLGYWQEQLQNASPLNLPTDYTRPLIQSIRGAVAGSRIDKDLSDQLNGFSRVAGVTLFMTLLTAFKALLHRYTGQQDICVGTPVAGRQQSNVERLIGFFVNTVVLRSSVQEGISFRELLQQVKRTTLEAYEHQEVPFEKVVDAVVKDRQADRSPLFQVMFVLQNFPETPSLDLGGVGLLPSMDGHVASKFDMTVSITEETSGLHLSVEYCTDIYREETILQMMGGYCELLREIVKDPGQTVGELGILTDAEERQLRNGFNDTAAASTRGLTVIDLLEEQAARTPHRTAVIFRDQHLTYRDLHIRSNRLGHYLREMGVREDILVPVCMQRGIDMIIGILGIMKAGGAYVPVDPQYPAERIAYMLENCGAGMVMSNSAAKYKIPPGQDILMIDLDELDPRITGFPEENVPRALTPGNLVYMIYTSGSTGRPKGVMIEHHSLVNILLAVADRVEFGLASSFLAVTTYSFDISCLELYLPLIKGGRLIIADEGEARDGYQLMEKISEHRPTHMQTTPSGWKVLLNCGWENKEHTMILAGGEWLTEEIKDALTEIGTVWNLYGPTETTIWSTGRKMERGRKVSIGSPFNNTQVYIVDKMRQLCPVGVVGQISIAGDGLARGYFGDPGATNNKFIANPFGRNAGERLYLTGDMGRWLPDGNIEYLGRSDHQMKIRGYRIEAGEVESALEQYDAVVQAAVAARPDIHGNVRLIAYVQSRLTMEKDTLPAYLRGKLPEYMIPSLFVFMDAMPMTANGKIDRRALPDPDISTLASREHVPPATGVEAKLADIWQDLLGVGPIGIYDSFFELGGHSLLATRALSAIYKAFLIKVPMRVFFQFPDISSLAKFIELNMPGEPANGEGVSKFEIITI